MMDERWYVKPIPESKWPFPRGAEIMCWWSADGRQYPGTVLECELHHNKYVYVNIELPSKALWGLLEHMVRLKTPLECLAAVGE